MPTCPLRLGALATLLLLSSSRRCAAFSGAAWIRRFHRHQHPATAATAHVTNPHHPSPLQGHARMPGIKMTSAAPLFFRSPGRPTVEPPIQDATTVLDNDDVPPVDPKALLSGQSNIIQKIGVIAIALTIAGGTFVLIQALGLLQDLLPAGWYTTWRDVTWSVPLGLIFVAAGLSHFALRDSFTAMVPPPGTWGGLWQVPAPGAEKFGWTHAEYHCYWSGVAEVCGGALLVASQFVDWLPVQLPAFLLWALVVAITPANVYMATHDIRPPGMPPIPYPGGHIQRAGLQCLLLALFWKLAVQ